MNEVQVGIGEIYDRRKMVMRHEKWEVGVWSTTPFNWVIVMHSDWSEKLTVERPVPNLYPAKRWKHLELKISNVRR